MISSYKFSAQYDPQHALSVAAGRLWAWLVIAACMAIGVAVGAAIVALVVTFWLPIVQVAGCLVVVGLFAVSTFPRAKPATCPYCGGRNISGGRGSWDCDDCGRGGSY